MNARIQILRLRRPGPLALAGGAALGVVVISAVIALSLSLAIVGGAAALGWMGWRRLTGGASSGPEAARPRADGVIDDVSYVTIPPERR